MGRNVEKDFSRDFNVYIYEDVATIEEGAERADTIITEYRAMGFKHFDVTVNSLPRDQKTGKRPAGFELNVDINGHVSDISRWDYDEDEPDAAEAVADPETALIGNEDDGTMSEPEPILIRG